MESANLAIIGAGKGGYEFLKVLLGMPGVAIKYVCDVRSDAKGMMFAATHGLRCVLHAREVLADPSVDLIIECTGRLEVFDELSRSKLPSVSLVGSSGARVMFSLLDSCNTANRSLQSYQINLERRIIERTEELERLNTELLQEKAATERLYEQQRLLNEERGRHLIHTTHQLKAPFAAIQNYVEIILDGYTGAITDETREIMRKVQARCELLSGTIRDMLELSKIKARVVELVPEEVDLRSVVHSVAERFSAAATVKRLQVIFDEPAFEVRVRTVPKQLFELLCALMENAVKYSPTDRIVTLRTAVGTDGRPFVSVIDQGIGIPKDNQAKVFAEFFRSNNAAHFDPNGNGLGLAIAKEIADLLDVTVDLESVLGQGSTFSVRF